MSRNRLPRPFHTTPQEQRIIDRVMGVRARSPQRFQIPNWLGILVAFAVVAFIYATVFSRRFSTFMQSSIDWASPFLTAWKELREEHEVTLVIVLAAMLLVSTLYEGKQRDRLIRRLVLRNRQLERAMQVDDASGDATEDASR